MQPTEIRSRGPKRSTSHAWIGEQNVCRTISSENVTCSCASVDPSLPCSGWMKSVHVYCGLEIDIIATNPSTICHHRFKYHGVADAAPCMARVDMRPPEENSLVLALVSASRRGSCANHPAAPAPGCGEAGRQGSTMSRRDARPRGPRNPCCAAANHAG